MIKNCKKCGKNFECKYNKISKIRKYNIKNYLCNNCYKINTEVKNIYFKGEVIEQ